jgi:hypothetical protein
MGLVALFDIVVNDLVSLQQGCVLFPCIPRSAAQKPDRKPLNFFTDMVKRAGPDYPGVSVAADVAQPPAASFRGSWQKPIQKAGVWSLRARHQTHSN